MKKIVAVCLFAAATQCAVAQTTVKKVVLEDFTGTWCGWCPEGTVAIEGLKVQYPNNFLGVASHNGDALQVPEGAAIDAGLNVTAYPNGSVDRFKFTGQAKIPMSRGQWVSKVGTRVSTPAIVSVSLSNLATDGTNYTGKINSTFNTAPAGTVPLNVQLYILEDSIAATGALEQGNYSTNVQGGADPLTNWFHNETLRKALGGNWGWTGVIPNAAVVGTKYTKDFSFTVPSTWNKKHIHVIAFVAYDGDTAQNRKEILNAEHARLSSFYPTAVTNLTNDIQASVYPNPTTATTPVGFTVNLQSDATIRLEVRDAAGRVVGAVHESYEIAGTHTVKWTPIGTGVTPGIYFANITASNGQRGSYKFSVQ